MTETFADSFYYIALLNPSDRYHKAAIRATQDPAGQIVTTIWVLTELADALSAPIIRGVTFNFLQRISQDVGTTIVTNSDWYARGLTIYGKRADKSWSLTDCISFAVMEDRGIRAALTGDHHYVQAGFHSLLSVD